MEVIDVLVGGFCLLSLIFSLAMIAIVRRARSDRD